MNRIRFLAAGTAYKCRAYPDQAAYAAFFAKRARYPRFKSRPGRQCAEYTARTDFLHKASTRLVRDHDVIVLEDLAVTNMVRNRTLAKAITECGWGTFRAAKTILAAGRAVAGGNPGHACGADVRHSGSSRVRSAVKQEPRPVRAGIPVHQGRE